MDSTHSTQDKPCSEENDTTEVKNVLIKLLRNKDVHEGIALLNKHNLDPKEEDIQKALTFALYKTAQDGATEKVKLLCKSGVDVKRRIFGASVLHAPSLRGHYSTVEYLIKEANVDVNSVADESNKTPLHYATLMGHIEIVELLCELGADIDRQDDMRFTPLHWASARGYVTVVEKLLDLGADRCKIDWLKRTAEQVAGEHCYTSSEKEAERKRQIKLFWENIEKRISTKTWKFGIQFCIIALGVILVKVFW